MPRRKQGPITPLVVEYLRENGASTIQWIADDLGAPASSVKTALYRGKGTLFRPVGDVSSLAGGQTFLGRPNLLWDLIGGVPGCPDQRPPSPTAVSRSAAT